MSAPVTDHPPLRTAPRRSAATRRAAVPAQRGADRRDRYEAADSAAGRAYARRDERTRRSTGTPRAGSAEPTRRAQFVLLVMGLLTTGLVLTLGLSTAAAADSYRLQAAREQAAALTEQAEGLRRSVAIAGSPTELARRAEALGMVPVRDAARLVVAPDGSVEVVGEPAVVRAPAPPAPPAPAVPPGSVVPPAAGPGAPGATAPDAVVPDAVPGPATEDAAVAADGTATDAAAAGAAEGAPAEGAPADGAPADGAAADGAATDAASTGPGPAAGGPAADPAPADPAAAGAN